MSRRNKDSNIYATREASVSIVDPSIIDENRTLLDSDSRQDKKESNRRMMKLFVGETLSTAFFFTLIYCMVATMNKDKEITKAVGFLFSGFCASLIIFLFAPISGAHFNPGITLSLVFTKKVSLSDFAIRMISQLLFGGLLAYGITAAIFPDIGSDPSILVLKSPRTDWFAYGMEIFLNFFLNTVIYMLSVHYSIYDKDTKEGSYSYARMSANGWILFMIGMTFSLLGYIGSNVSGGCFNFVRVFWPAVFALDFDTLQIFFVGQIAGPFISAFFCYIMHRYRIIGTKKTYDLFY
jgi:aquaporin-4